MSDRSSSPPQTPTELVQGRYQPAINPSGRRPADSQRFSDVSQSGCPTTTNHTYQNPGTCHKLPETLCSGYTSTTDAIDRSSVTSHRPGDIMQSGYHNVNTSSDWRSASVRSSDVQSGHYSINSAGDRSSPAFSRRLDMTPSDYLGNINPDSQVSVTSHRTDREQSGCLFTSSTHQSSALSHKPPVMDTGQDQTNQIIDTSLIRQTKTAVTCRIPDQSSSSSYQPSDVENKGYKLHQNAQTVHQQPSEIVKTLDQSFAEFHKPTDVLQVGYATVTPLEQAFSASHSPSEIAYGVYSPESVYLNQSYTTLDKPSEVIQVGYVTTKPSNQHPPVSQTPTKQRLNRDRKGQNAPREKYPPTATGQDGNYSTTDSIDQSVSTINDDKSSELSEQEPVPWWKRPFGKRRRDEEKQVENTQTTLRELIIYLFFLTIFLIVTLGMTSSMMYYHTLMLSNLFVETSISQTDVNFQTMTRVSDFWEFAETVMLDGVFWDFWYSNRQMVRPTVGDARHILHENKLIGVPRLRQVKVRNDSCTVSDSFRRSFSSCYDYYSYGAEDRKAFGLGTSPGWVYTSEDVLESGSYTGRISTYGGGGFYEDLPMKHGDAYNSIQELKNNLWIDRGTRAVFLDFTVYNANINLFCVVKLILELPPTGGVLPSWSFQSVKLIRYTTAFDFVILACEILFILYIIYYTVEEIVEIAYYKTQYFRSFWNLVDLIIILMAYLCIIFGIIRLVVVNQELENLINTTGSYANFNNVTTWQVRFNSMLAVTVFLSWIKIFKYIGFNKTMVELKTTLARCAKDVLGFSVMFFIVFLAFAELGYLLFGTQVEDFKTFGDAVISLLRAILGDFDYTKIERVHRVFGPLYFIAFIFFIFLILLNMFLAILNDTYSQVKSEISIQDDQQVSDFLKRGAVNVLRRVGYKGKEKDDTPDDEKQELTYDQIRQILKRCNFTDLEIGIFCARYDIRHGGQMKEEDFRRLLDDSESRRLQAVGVPGARAALPPAPTEQVELLQGRVDELEQQVTVMLSRMEELIAMVSEATERLR